MTDSTNSTLAGTIAQIAVVMTDFLFWDVPWSDGRLGRMKLTYPKGASMNCTFPAACGEAPAVGVQAKIAVSDCIARMLYSAGDPDINAPWQGIWYPEAPVSSMAGIIATASPSPKVSTMDMGPDSAPRPHATAFIAAGNQHPLRWHQRRGAHRDAYPSLLFHSQPLPHGGGAGNFNVGNRQLSHFT